MRLLSIAFALLFSLMFLIDQASAQEASDLIKRAQLHRGVCCVLGAGDGTLALALARASEMLIHVRDADAKAVERTRQQADEAGYSIQRVLVEKGDLSVLPHANNTLDLVVSNQVELLDLLKVSDVLRALRPQGVAILGGKDAREALRTWASDISTADFWSDAPQSD